MISRRYALWVGGLLLAAMLPNSDMAAGEFAYDCGSVASGGKVCQLVCETKKLSAICYACECETVCLPGPSRRGCKHGAACGGEPACGECDACGCRSCAPECEFCWRDWFACGCARPRTVKALTKYQAEKEIGWYRWEVVEAACGECVSQSGSPADRRCVYKAAPADAAPGDILPVTDEEWSELAAIVGPGGDQAPASEQAVPLGPAPAGESIAERIGRWLRR